MTIFLLASRFARFIVLPVAFIAGALGVYIERKLNVNMKEIPYLDRPLHENSIQRQSEIYKREIKMVINNPGQTLSLNKSRTQDD